MPWNPMITYHRPNNAPLSALESLSLYERQLLYIREHITCPVVSVNKVEECKKSLIYLKNRFSTRPLPLTEQEEELLSLNVDTARVYDFKTRLYDRTILYLQYTELLLAKMKMIDKERQNTSSGRMIVSNAQCNLAALPDDVLNSIATYLTLGELAKSAATCKSLKLNFENNPVKRDLVYLSHPDGLMLNLTLFRQQPSLGDLSRARKKALKAGIFVSRATKLLNVPQHLEDIFTEKMEKAGNNQISALG